MLKPVVALLALPLLYARAQAQGYSSPPDGDTTGYWQQRIAYTIVATLDERAQRVRARGAMRYVNHSPDTLREMYVHQHLNAFRPHSLWSREDERLGVERFQHLGDPDYAYERFTAPVRVNGQLVSVTYPGAPDSTIARFALPAPLLPGDSVIVSFEWDARPSTLPRRQARRGRSWDLAQWYPKVAVYDRGGWEPNALQPAGEFYGEFGTYDVTLVVPADQVLGATGVPVSGDPGWARVIRTGAVHTTSQAYEALPAPPPADVPAGYKAVRFVARDVHHFAWSASPDYRYEGGVYVRQVPGVRWATWDTVAIHALYRPGDDTTWGGLRAVGRTINALRWLESIYGAYAYPQMTVLHRIEGGGTEFPMMQMNGSASQGLLLHEGGHVFTYGILANNEWRSGWMDEGLTSYQTDWAQGGTPQERLRRGLGDGFVPVTGYRLRAVRPLTSRFDAIGRQQTMTDLGGDAEPIGTAAQDFRDFGTYNDMIYTRAQVMYGQLRDVLGDSLFVEFLHDYYARWALRHVDARAMRASAERASGRDLKWFFDQWIHRTGVVDYSLEDARWSRRGDSGWVTQARVRRRGEYAHAIAVGVRTEGGWTLAQLPDVTSDDQIVRVVTASEPLEVRLDPYHFSWDWDRRNDVLRAAQRVNLDWPLLRQLDRDRSVLLARPAAWYSAPGGATAGLRLRSSYLALVDQYELGAVYAAREGVPTSSALQYWVRVENPYLPFRSRPAMDWSVGAARLDDILKADISWRRDRSVGPTTRTIAVTVTHTDAVATALLPESWATHGITDGAIRGSWRSRRLDGYALLDASLVAGTGDGNTFTKLESALGRVLEGENASVGLRGYGALYVGAQVPQRALLLSARDPVSTFGNHWWRPRGAILKEDDVHWLPLGGAALRGYRWDLDAMSIVGTNGDLAYTVGRLRGSAASLDIRLHAFGDAAYPEGSAMNEIWLSDAGVGVSVRGRLYDSEVYVRLDAPLYVSHPSLAMDVRSGGRIGWRWVLTTTDIW